MISRYPMIHTLASCALWSAIGVMAISSSGCGGGGSETTMADAGSAGDSDASVPLTELPERTYDYNAALRTASLRLRGQLPTLQEIKTVADAADAQRQAAYETQIQAYIDSAEFSGQMVDFWRDTFKMGGTTELDTAPVLAAQITVEGRSFTDLLTATTGTCPTFDSATGTFTAQDCNNGVPTHAGVLTNPGVMKHFQSNMAFRRVRWLQEAFDCTAFPAETSPTPQDVGGAQLYTGLLPFEQHGAPDNGGAIDFQDASSVVCANCHSTMNIMAPLLTYFDDNGIWQDQMVSLLPTDGTPVVTRADYITDAASTGWRQGMPASDLPALGAAMASDPAVAQCMVARVWNFALGRGDIVDALAVVPAQVIAEQVTAFHSGGQDMSELMFNVFTDPNFVQF